MSTRCQLIVWEYNPESDNFDRKLNFYHHHDGYPSFMEEDIKKAIKSLDEITIEKIAVDLPKYDSEYELEELDSEHGDIEYVWHLFLTDFSVELKYVNLWGANTELALYEPNKCGKKYIKSWVMVKDTKEMLTDIPIELSPENMNLLEQGAKEAKMTVEDYASYVINYVYKKGMLDDIFAELLKEKESDEGED